MRSEIEFMRPRGRMLTNNLEIVLRDRTGIDPHRLRVSKSFLRLRLVDQTIDHDVRDMDANLADQLADSLRRGIAARKAEEIVAGACRSWDSEPAQNAGKDHELRAPAGQESERAGDRNSRGVGREMNEAGKEIDGGRSFGCRRGNVQ